MRGTGMELLRGTLDLLILKTVSRAPLHGYGIASAIRTSTGDLLNVQEGVLYPTLRKLEARKALRSEWGYTETGRQARYYELTAKGRRELHAQNAEWQLYVHAMQLALGDA
jgi:PadR family transcriptional regulator, regulatory protein PadR